MQVLIVGAGVSGLTLAYQLHKQNIDFTLVEARSRLGGRILTDFPENRPSVPLDYGAMWYWDNHKHIEKLLKELRIKRFPQYITGLGVEDHGPRTTPQQVKPPQDVQAYRVKDGMTALIDALYKKLPEDRVHLNTVVNVIEATDDGITVEATHDDKTVFYDADYVIVTIPPALASSSIHYKPRLPEQTYLAMRKTHTWMAQAMKVFLVYDAPFWRKMGLSGYGISQNGIVGEFHDASPDKQTFGVLFGFLSNSSSGRNMNADERKEAIITQIKRMYGWQAAEIKVYSEYDWTYDTFTSDSGSSRNDLLEHPDYGDPLLQEPIMDGRLFWGASEVSTVSGGYVDGAVYRANELAETIVKAMA